MLQLVCLHPYNTLEMLVHCLVILSYKPVQTTSLHIRRSMFLQRHTVRSQSQSPNRNNATRHIILTLGLWVILTTPGDQYLPVPQGCRFFFTPSCPDFLGSSQPPVKWVPGLSPGVKTAKHRTSHPTSSCATWLEMCGPSHRHFHWALIELSICDCRAR